MRIRYCKPDELSACQAMLGPAYGGIHGKGLRSLWDDLLESGTIRMSVIEDPEAPPGKRIEAFAVSAFLSDDAYNEYRASPQTDLPAWVYRRATQDHSTLLPLREIARANAAQGLNLVVLHFALRNPDISDPHTQQVLNAANFAFFFLHRGYRIKSFLQEVYDPAHAEYMRGAGCVSLDAHAVRQSNEERQSWVFRLDEATLTPGSSLSFLFRAPPPRYLFSPAEQRLLEQALFGDTDAELSRHLGVTADTVRKTWKAIYNRISQVSPRIVHDDTEQAMGAKRGTEKRRHVLEHIRNHLEELRPYKRAPDRGA